MLTIDEALRAVLEASRPLPPRHVPLQYALGCKLGEDITADIDLPPFDKALVDGFAVRTVDLGGPDRWLGTGETILAGQTPSRRLGPREAATIMTGAPIPAGCDAVVMHERTQTGERGVRIDEPEVRAGQNILPRGREMRQVPSSWMPARSSGRRTWACSHRSAGPSPGSSNLRSRSSPPGTSSSTPDRRPGPGQIRNSNAVMLEALVKQDRANPVVFPIVADEPVALRSTLGLALDCNLVLITGGVSAGQRDLVPETLESLGVRQIFHKVRLKPGKPIWFGVGPSRTEEVGQPTRGGHRDGPLVFGLPGNPVSGVVGFLLFVRPALRVLSHGLPMPPLGLGRLARPFRHRGDRPTYHPARLEVVPGEDQPRIETLDWAGSADLLTVARAGIRGFRRRGPRLRGGRHGRIPSLGVAALVLSHPAAGMVEYWHLIRGLGYPHNNDRIAVADDTKTCRDTPPARRETAALPEACLSPDDEGRTTDDCCGAGTGDPGRPGEPRDRLAAPSPGRGSGLGPGPLDDLHTPHGVGSAGLGRPDAPVLARHRPKCARQELPGRLVRGSGVLDPGGALAPPDRVGSLDRLDRAGVGLLAVVAAVPRAGPVGRLPPARP